MKKTLSNIVLFVIGVLLCTYAVQAAPYNEPVVLTSTNHIVFSGVVDDMSVAKAQLQLNAISRVTPVGGVIYLVLDTPGGSVSAGNLFIDYAKSLPHQIKSICIFCASMGYHFFQSFGERLVYPSSTLMSHRARLGGMAGQVPGELESRLASIKRILLHMDTTAANRVGISVEDYRKLIYDELWLDGVTAVNTRHADRLARIKCSSELASGTRTEVIRTFLGPVTVTFSKCPLISGILDAKLGKESKFRSVEEAVRFVRKVKRSETWSF